MFSVFYRIVFFLCFFCCSTSVFADELIVEPDMGRAPVLSAIRSTAHQLNLVMYGFTDDVILDALIQQKIKNRSIKIILEEKPYKSEQQNEKTLSVIRKFNIAWRGHVQDFRLIHQKTLLIDDKKALIMTFNFTKSSFKNQRNFALMIDDPNELREISRVFSADFNDIPIITSDKHLVWSPDNSRERIAALIEDARHDIQIYAQAYNDYQLIGALAKAAKNGVKVRLLLSQPLREKQLNYLERAGVEIRLSKKLYIHAKVIIIDHQEALLGSINFTKSSLDNNRELSIITENQKIVQELSNTFEHDWQNNPTASMKLDHTWGNQHTSAMNHFMPNERTIFRLIKKLNRYLQGLC